MPVRRIPFGRRSATGTAIVKGRGVDYESALERDLLTVIDVDPAVRRVIGQPVRIPYRTPDGQSHSYVPDFRVDRLRGPSVIVEVKYRGDLRTDWRELKPRLRTGVAYARAHGMRFKILTDVEIRTPLLENVRFLKRYAKGPARVDDPTEEHLVATLETLGAATPQALLEVAYAHPDNRLTAVPAMWRLVNQGRIGTRLSLPLTMHSEIWVAEGLGTLWPGPHSYAFPLATARWRRLGLPAPPPDDAIYRMPCLEDASDAVPPADGVVP